MRPFNQQMTPMKNMKKRWRGWPGLPGPHLLGQAGSPGFDFLGGSKGHPGRVIWMSGSRYCCWHRCNPRVFQSAKSFGLLFSSSAARAPSPSSISWKNRMQNNDLGLVLIRRSRIFFTQSMIQLLFLYLSYSFYGSASAFQPPRCVFHQSPWLSHGGQARASWRVFMNATLSRTLPSPKTAVPVVVALVTAAVGSALKETQNRTCIAAWLYHTFKTCTEWSSQNDIYE